MSKRKLVYIVSDVEKSLAFEWTAHYFQSRFDLFFLIIGKSDTPLALYLGSLQIQFSVVDSNSSLVKKWWQVFRILQREKPIIVHAHLWHAMLVGLSASWILSVEKRIFTRHHATIHHQLHTSGLKWDKLCSWFATDIVAISETIKMILVRWEHVNPAKVRVIHHGFDLRYLQQINQENVEQLRLKYNLRNGIPVVGVIARYTEWKGIQYTIQAFKQIRTDFPHACLVLANAVGDYSNEIKKKLQELPPHSFREIAFENDLASLYQLFNVFVHVPTDEYSEAFGQTYVEALAAGIPSVFTLSGVASEFIVHEQNALVVPFCDSESISDSIKRILNDTELKQKLINNGKKSATLFPVEKMLTSLEVLYNLRKHS